MSERVICKNCKHFYVPNSDYIGDAVCTSPKLGIIKDNVFGDKRRVISTDDLTNYPNVGGRCDLYEKELGFWEAILNIIRRTEND